MQNQYIRRLFICLVQGAGLEGYFASFNGLFQKTVGTPLKGDMHICGFRKKIPGFDLYFLDKGILKV